MDEDKIPSSIFCFFFLLFCLLIPCRRKETFSLFYVKNKIVNFPQCEIPLLRYHVPILISFSTKKKKKS